jgi:hypothetical protein
VSSIERDIVDEAGRLLGGAAERGTVVRLIGGLAVRLHLPGRMHPVLERDYRDIDFVAPTGASREVSQLFEEMGYTPNRGFNTLNGDRRLLYFDDATGRRIDVFLGTFEMCHTIPLTDRLEVDPVTIPLAELLLTKLQIFKLNEKDLRDILALLHEHDVGNDDFEKINADQVALLCSRDWGLWRTCKLNVQRTREALDTYGFSAADRSLLAGRLDALWGRIEQRPKSRAWRLRARVGDRVRWYDEPDETE